MELISEMQGWFNIKNQSIKLKEKYHMIVSTDTEKSA